MLLLVAPRRVERKKVDRIQAQEAYYSSTQHGANVDENLRMLCANVDLRFSKTEAVTLAPAKTPTVEGPATAAPVSGTRTCCSSRSGARPRLGRDQGPPLGRRPSPIGSSRRSGGVGGGSCR